MSVHIQLTHSHKCTCLKCQLAHMQEPEIVALEYKRKTGKAVLDNIEKSDSGYWIVNYHWVANKSHYQNIDKAGWATVDQWNKQCLKPVEAA